MALIATNGTLSELRFTFGADQVCTLEADVGVHGKVPADGTLIIVG